MLMDTKSSTMECIRNWMDNFTLQMFHTAALNKDRMAEIMQKRYKRTVVNCLILSISALKKSCMNNVPD